MGCGRNRAEEPPIRVGTKDIDNFHVYIRTDTAPQEKKVAINFLPDSQYTTFSILKQRIQEVLGYPVQQQQLSYGPRSLEDNGDSTLEDAKIFSGYTLDITIVTDYVIGECVQRLDGYYGKTFANSRPDIGRLRPYSIEWIAASLLAKGYSSEEAEKIASDLRPSGVDFTNKEEMQLFAERVNKFLMRGVKGARGPRGPTGDVGEKGRRGPPGFNGTDGSRGAPGKRGPSCEQTGDAKLMQLLGRTPVANITESCLGLRGKRGEKGSKGDKGYSGLCAVENDYRQGGSYRS